MPPTFKSSTQAPRKTPIQCTEALPFPTPNPQNPNSQRLQTLTQPPNTTQHNTTPAAPNRQPDTSVVRTAGGVAAESEVPAGAERAARARRPRRAPVARAGGEAATARGGRRGEKSEKRRRQQRRRGEGATRGSGEIYSGFLMWPEMGLFPWRISPVSWRLFYFAPGYLGFKSISAPTVPRGLDD